jgi:hypothetical protein
VSLTPREELFRAAGPEDDVAFGRAVDDYRRTLLETMADDIGQTLTLASALSTDDGPDYREGFTDAGRLAAEYLRAVARGTAPEPEPPPAGACTDCAHSNALHDREGCTVTVPCDDPDFSDTMNCPCPWAGGKR